MKLGIVGLPNAGKTTVFNALTHAGALATAYAFSSAEANHGVVAVPDERLDQPERGAADAARGTRHDRGRRHPRPGRRRRRARSGSGQPLPVRHPRGRRRRPRGARLRQPRSRLSPRRRSTRWPTSRPSRPSSSSATSSSSSGAATRRPRRRAPATARRKRRWHVLERFAGELGRRPPRPPDRTRRPTRSRSCATSPWSPSGRCCSS